MGRDGVANIDTGCNHVGSLISLKFTVSLTSLKGRWGLCSHKLAAATEENKMVTDHNSVQMDISENNRNMKACKVYMISVESGVICIYILLKQYQLLRLIVDWTIVIPF